jgi:hypothetical protein
MVIAQTVKRNKMNNHGVVVQSIVFDRPNRPSTCVQGLYVTVQSRQQTSSYGKSTRMPTVEIRSNTLGAHQQRNAKTKHHSKSGTHITLWGTELQGSPLSFSASKRFALPKPCDMGAVTQTPCFVRDSPFPPPLPRPPALTALAKCFPDHIQAE